MLEQFKELLDFCYDIFITYFIRRFPYRKANSEKVVLSRGDNGIDPTYQGPESSLLFVKKVTTMFCA